MTDAVERAPTLPDAFQELAPSLLAQTSCEFLNLSIHEPRRDSMLTRYWKQGGESGTFDPLPVGDAVAGWAWQYQEPIAISDTGNEPRFPLCMCRLRGHGVGFYTALPVSTPSVHFGAVGLGRHLARAVDPEGVELLARVARMAATFLEKQRASRALQEQKSLLAISRELSSTFELDRLLPAILSSVRGVVEYERSALSLLDEDGQNVRLFGDTLPWEAHLSHAQRVPVEQSLSGQSIGTRRVSFLTAAELRDMSAPLAKAMHNLGILSVCTVPLIAGDRIWGALNTGAMSENAFGQPEVDYLQQVANLIAVALRNAHAYRQIADLKDRLVQEKRYLENEIRVSESSGEIVGNSPGLKKVLDYASIVADTDSTVLITGETGTGKERIARIIHTMSRRRDRSFIKINCAAIPTGLLESELFGHEKGAFTGAISRKIGRLELADKGTLLLDEVGDIPLELQPKLLRVLQDQEFERLGGTKTIHVDVRLVAATNRDLQQAVEARQFRSDLYYRLNVFPLHLPPLRERREDIPKLIVHFLEQCSARLHRRIDVIPKETIDAMVCWNWPGNIRELENFIERSVILSTGKRLNAPLAELRGSSLPPSDSTLTLRDREREHIVAILRQSRGALSGPAGAAARLGLKRTTLQYKMQRLGILRTDYLN